MIGTLLKRVIQLCPGGSHKDLNSTNWLALMESASFIRRVTCLFCQTEQENDWQMEMERIRWMLLALVDGDERCQSKVCVSHYTAFVKSQSPNWKKLTAHLWIAIFYHHHCLPDIIALQSQDLQLWIVLESHLQQFLFTSLKNNLSILTSCQVAFVHFTPVSLSQWDHMLSCKWSHCHTSPNY